MASRRRRRGSRRLTFDRIKESNLLIQSRVDSVATKFGDRRDLNPGPLGLQSSVLTTRPLGQPRSVVVVD